MQEDRFVIHNENISNNMLFIKKIVQIGID